MSATRARSLRFSAESVVRSSISLLVLHFISLFKSVLEIDSCLMNNFKQTNKITKFNINGPTHWKLYMLGHLIKWAILHSFTHIQLFFSLFKINLFYTFHTRNTPANIVLYLEVISNLFQSWRIVSENQTISYNFNQIVKLIEQNFFV